MLLLLVGVLRCHCRNFPSRVLMTFSLPLHAGGHFYALEFCELVSLLDEASTRCGIPSSLSLLLCDTCRLLNELSSLLVAVHSLSAECGRLC